MSSTRCKRVAFWLCRFNSYPRHCLLRITWQVAMLNSLLKSQSLIRRLSDSTSEFSAVIRVDGPVALIILIRLLDWFDSSYSYLHSPMFQGWRIGLQIRLCKVRFLRCLHFKIYLTFSENFL